jgi:hypothetical protein
MQLTKDDLVEMAMTAGITVLRGDTSRRRTISCATADELAAFIAAHTRKVLEDVEPVEWQFRWTNPRNEPHQPPEMTAWEPVRPRDRLQTLQQRIEELRYYTVDGKPCYEVRALVDATTVAALKSRADALQARGRCGGEGCGAAGFAAKTGRDRGNFPAR